MNISSIDKTIRAVLKSSYYKIPRFQRPYSWEKEHIEDFWNDSIRESSGDYFIGSMVVYEISNDTFGVVDGQQRLTTITMLLGTIREAFKSIGEESLAKGTQGMIERKDLDDELNYVLQTESSYPFFHENVQKFDASEVTDIPAKKEEEHIKKGYDLLKYLVEKEIESIEVSTTISAKEKHKQKIEALKNIRDKILNLKVIYIELDNEDDAYIIFETLNTRGKDLRVSDLVKNHLTKMLPKKNKSVDLSKDKWTEARTIIEGSNADLNMDSFLHHFWLSKYEFTTQKKLFKSLKQTVDRKNAKIFLDSILNETRIYREFLDITYREWKKEELDLKNSLNALNIFRVKQQIPMLLSVMREYERGGLKLKRVKDIVNAIECFHFIFTAVTSQRSSGGISFMYAYHARQLDQATPNDKTQALDELKQKLRKKLPTKDEFIANLMELNYSSVYTKEKALVKYILTKYDNYFSQKSKSGTSIDYNHMTIEHIYAEKDTSKSIGISDIGKIGNLLLIEESLNGQLGNKKFSNKHPIYLKSKIFLDDEVRNASDWDKSNILNRTEKIAEKLFDKVFKF
ncbi:DUF262 domain-containing protein [Flagellimonas taeanensis]|uniref:DUF262 domain-containing protein n=1 Tax=Flavobacteriaceae TaxID=49546 RepID=UPI000E6940E4|nr:MULTISPECIES: DUF262 domain-containing protein [Allomuricauda]MDC6385194.1 DUF262 domain-containing HNH endonuclease family protein [Muricauda sp. SK9]RIV52727.1 DUF262 domain-containing protein [Allomuricauda taeanensis]